VSICATGTIFDWMLVGLIQYDVITKLDIEKAFHAVFAIIVIFDVVLS